MSNEFVKNYKSSFDVVNEIGHPEKLSDGYRNYIFSRHVRDGLKKMLGMKDLVACYIRVESDSHDIISSKTTIDVGSETMYLVFKDKRIVQLVNSEWGYFSDITKG